MKIADAHARVVESFPYAIQVAEQSIACYEDRIRELRAFVKLSRQCMAEERLPGSEREADRLNGKPRVSSDILKTAMANAEEEPGAGVEAVQRALAPPTS